MEYVRCYIRSEIGRDMEKKVFDNVGQMGRLQWLAMKIASFSEFIRNGCASIVTDIASIVCAFCCPCCESLSILVVIVSHFPLVIPNHPFHPPFITSCFQTLLCLPSSRQKWS